MKIVCPQFLDDIYGCLYCNKVMSDFAIKLPEMIQRQKKR